MRDPIDCPDIGYVGSTTGANRLSSETARSVQRLDAARIVDEPAVIEPVGTVVTEYDLADHSGITITQTVRDRAPEKPVLMFADGTEAVASDAVTAGVTEYVSRARHDDPYAVLADRLARLETTQRERNRHTRRIDNLFRNALDGMALLDDDGQYTYVNERHATLYGYDEPDAMLGMNWRELYDEAEIDRFERDVLPVLRETGQWRGEATGQCADGTTFEQQLSLIALPSGGIGCVVRDVTDRKRQRERLRRQNERLDRFASVVSHDLRTPLQVAIGRLEAAQRECDSEHLDELAGALDRMDALIDDVLALAREGDDVEDPTEVSLDRVAHESWGTVDTDGGELVVETALSVEADRSRLRRVFSNLFSNAIEHGADGSTRRDAGDVTVRVDDLGGDGFYVADDGPGIPADERDAVLESGYTTADEGTGYGLAIVTEIADAHDWSVTVSESRAGGARIEFRI